MNDEEYGYGASFNCKVGRNDVGGGGEGDTTLDYVSHSLEKLEEFLEDSEEGRVYICDRDHAYVGQSCDLGGEVVSVIGELEDSGAYFSVVAVIFKDPVVPTVV